MLAKSVRILREVRHGAVYFNPVYCASTPARRLKHFASKAITCVCEGSWRETLLFMTPELKDKCLVSPKSDIYALEITLLDVLGRYGSLRLQDLKGPPCRQSSSSLSTQLGGHNRRFLSKLMARFLSYKIAQQRLFINRPRIYQITKFQPFQTQQQTSSDLLLLL